MTWANTRASLFCLVALLVLLKVHSQATQFEQIHQPWLERWR